MSRRHSPRGPYRVNPPITSKKRLKERAAREKNPPKVRAHFGSKR
jgi:hypothetical protein